MLPSARIAVADLGDVGRRLLQQRLDMILGREIFDAARLAIDIDGHAIAVVSRAQAPRGVPLGLETEHGVETVPVLRHLRITTDFSQHVAWLEPRD